MACSKSAVHGYPQALVDEIDKEIGSSIKGSEAPITVFENICDKLISLGIVKRRVLKVDEVACHPCNRGTLGLNGHNCHRNGNEIDKVGVDLNELTKAACFEMSGLPHQRAEQIKFNQRVISMCLMHFYLCSYYYSTINFQRS